MSDLKRARRVERGLVAGVNDQNIESDEDENSDIESDEENSDIVADLADRPLAPHEAANSNLEGDPPSSSAHQEATVPLEEAVNPNLLENPLAPVVHHEEATANPNVQGTSLPSLPPRKATVNTNCLGNSQSSSVTQSRTVTEPIRPGGRQSFDERPTYTIPDFPLEEDDDPAHKSNEVILILLPRRSFRKCDSENADFVPRYDVVLRCDFIPPRRAV